MKFSKLTEYLVKIDSTTKRLEITTIIAELLQALEPEETEEATYLILGSLKAPYENPKFSIAEEMMIRVLVGALPESSKENIQKEFGVIGDLGEVFEKLGGTHKSASLPVVEVHKQLLEIAEISGSGSQEAKVTKMVKLIKALSAVEAKYVIRMVLGQTRLGFSELTIIAGLAEMIGDKKAAKKIEEIYSLHPEIGKIVKNVKADGLKGLSKIQIEIGVPILAQRCQRVANAAEAIEKMGEVWAEYKFDGTRVQLHLDRNKKPKSKKAAQENLFDTGGDKYFVKTFTRNLEETTDQYPDIIEAALKQLDADSVVLDGEAIGYDKITGEFLPFQETIQRKRKHNINEAALNIPLKYFVFDILYLNGQNLTTLPLHERREIFEKHLKKGEVIQPSAYFRVHSAQQLTESYNLAKEKSLEGLVIKKPDSPYQAGARSFNWVKLKTAQEKILEDTIDAVILGYYFGRGVRAGFGVGGILVGIWDEKDQVFKTLTKIGTGLKDDDFRYVKEICDKNKIPSQPKNVVMDKIYAPDVWVNPKIVVEMGGDEITPSNTHSAGYAVRFPRLLKFRDDKSVKDITTLKEIEDLHKIQKRAYYSGN